MGVIRAYLSAGQFIADISVLERVISAAAVADIVGVVLAVALGRLTAPKAPWVLTAGAITYPLYLIHNRAGNAMIDAMPWLPDWLAVLLVIAVMLLASYAIYRFAERPLGNWIRRAGFAWSKPLANPGRPTGRAGYRL